MPESDGFLEGLGADVLHITYPLHFVRASVPTLFSIYDLQHRHYPRIFCADHLAWRELVYPVAFRESALVATDSYCVRSDVIQQYGVDPAKVYAVPLAAVTDAYEPVSERFALEVQRKHGLPLPFALYPALTYEHKNHVRLLEAVAGLRDRHGVTINVVCTGQLKLFWPSVRRMWQELRLQEQVRFLGFVSSQELRALYGLAQFMVFPSLFEGAGLPVLEAFREGAAVCCSDIPALREYADGAALFFDPTSAEGIATALRQMSVDTDLRDRLRRLGRDRVTTYSWEHTAKVYRALYRKVAQRSLSEEDDFLLRQAGGTAPPLTSPNDGMR